MFLCREQDDLYILCTSTLFSLHAPQSGHEEGSIPFAGFWLQRGTDQRRHSVKKNPNDELNDDDCSINNSLQIEGNHLTPV